MNVPTKLDAPRYFRVYSKEFITDEVYAALSNEQLGAFFRLMLAQWTNGGTLPSDIGRLALLGHCSSPDMQALLDETGKLVAAEELSPKGPKGRVAIPYLWREWVEVNEEYERNRRAGEASGVARKKKSENGATIERVLNGRSTVVDQVLNPSPTAYTSEETPDSEKAAATAIERPPQRAPSKRAAPTDPNGPGTFQRTAHDTWEARHGEKPPWGAAEYTSLAKAFQKAGADRVGLAWGRFLDSTERFFAGHSPRKFLQALDQFVAEEPSGPAARFSEKGQRNIATAQRWIERTTE